MPILTENVNPNTENIDLESVINILTLMNNEDKKVASSVEKVLPQVADAVNAIVKAFQNNGRLAYFGSGTSGRIGILDASECPPTFSVDKNLVQAFIAGGNDAVVHAVEHAEDNLIFAQKDILTFNPQKNDVVVALSASGNPNYCLEVLRLAKDCGATTVAVSSNPDAKIKDVADIFINPLVGPEVIAGSSRLKSGTAQKLIVNMLTTASMIRIGKTYKNLMVDVCVSNDKLYKRACHIIADITGVSLPNAESYLKKAHNRVKTACVMILKDCSCEKADFLLNKHNGILRKVLQDNADE